ncbi:MAG: helix-turn-helix domain-containing protein [Patescibacteria group bacterium]
MTDLRQALAKLDLSESEIDVYLAMVEGASSVREIMKITRRKRPTAYYALNALLQRGLVSKTSTNDKGVFRVEPVGSLNGLATKKLREAEHLAEEVKKMAEGIESKPRGEERPQVSFFEGIDAVKMRVMYTLYNRSRLIYSIVPSANSFWQNDDVFSKSYVEERVRRGIRTKNLWEDGSNKDFLKKYYQELSHVRLLPKEMRNVFSTTIFFYDDKTLYISSRKNNYCILVQSEEHFAMMRAIFDSIWANSKDLT